MPPAEIRDVSGDMSTLLTPEIFPPGYQPLLHDYRLELPSSSSVANDDIQEPVLEADSDGSASASARIPSPKVQLHPVCNPMEVDMASGEHNVKAREESIDQVEFIIVQDQAHGEPGEGIINSGHKIEPITAGKALERVIIETKKTGDCIEANHTADGTNLIEHPHSSFADSPSTVPTMEKGTSKANYSSEEEDDDDLMRELEAELNREAAARVKR
eukprot:Protomagalhaensia_sp_Gyna_25__4916@NODE_526_length_3209_cov_68_673502_g410_i0_p4_GENE_NODE_526_length_3209_cov_68_673502_g410_i0NODE_526_length_3209_cov_68_673502_g410_i0_p4_ORF_typecomplete_len216_score28_80_NODE_526_length_3209_cov_68_673502_g410_i016342281